MSQKGLEWAHRLRADLMIRIDDLRAALADIEPLRLELERLLGQLKGVERLIAVYEDQLGDPKPAWAMNAVALGEQIRRPDELPAPTAAEDSVGEVMHVPPPTHDGAIAGVVVRRKTHRMSSFCSEIAAKTFLAAKLWLRSRFMHHSA
jgi:hypothetical protein